MEAVAVSGRRQSLAESKVVLLHLAASLSFSKSSFPETEKLLQSRICDELLKAKNIPFEIFSASEDQVSFKDILSIFDMDDDEKNNGGEYYFVVVRRTAKDDGKLAPNMDDFAQTNIPMARQSRIPKGFIETREVYEPEVAFEEFLDNAIQYVQHSPVKIISATISPSENRISFLDTGEGIRYDDIQKWATPAEPTTVVTPVLWNHERVGKHWLNTPVITIGRKDLNSLKTLQSPLHNAQFGVLNWWGLGGKLAAANLGGKQSQLILKTKPKSGKPGMAVVRPGIWNYEVGQLSEADFPKDDIIKLPNVSSFIEFTIANADLQKLLRDTRLQEYEKKLSVEFCNVYYPYLIGVDQLAARVQSLNEANPEVSILSDPIPWELPADLNGPRITLNRKAVEPRKCFVHRCLNKARCAFSFRLEFPMEVGADIISYEVNTTILYFPAREGAPDFDERLTKTFDSKQTFAFWNGKLMFNHEIDFINDWKLKTEISTLLDIERRIRVFVHFSRTFKPKQNKEGIDDREALQKYRSMASNLKNPARDEVIAFLRNCHSIDGKSELIFEGGKVVAVIVAGKSEIRFGKYYDITCPAPKRNAKSTVYSDCIFAKVDDKNLATDALLIGCFPSLDGDEVDKKNGVMFKIVRVSAKSIGRAEQSKFGLDETKTKPYLEVTPKTYMMTFFRRKDNEEIKVVRSGEYGIDAHVSMVNAAGMNIFEAAPAQGMTKKVTAYVESLQSYMNESKPHLEIEFDPPSAHTPIILLWNPELLCWVCSVDDLTQHATQNAWKMNLICRPSGEGRKPHIFAMLNTPLKLEIAEGQPDKITIDELPPEFVLGVTAQVTFTLKDVKDRSISRALRELFSTKLVGAPNVKVQHATNWDAGKGAMAVTFTGQLPTKSLIKFELAYGARLKQVLPITIKPAAVKQIVLLDPPKFDDIVNNSQLSCGFSGRDAFGNDVPVEDCVIVDGDLVTRPQRMSDSIDFNVTAWLFLPDAEPRVLPKSLKYPELKAEMRDYRIPAFVDPLDSGGAVFCTFFDFVVENSKDKVRCFPGDAVWLKSSGREHLLRIHAFKRIGSVTHIVGNYFFAENCDAAFVPDLKKDEAVMSGTRVEIRAEIVKYWGKVWILSLSAYQSIKSRNINFGEVKYCRRVYISPRKFISLDVGTTPSQQEEIKVIAGHQEIGSIGVDYSTQAGTPLFQHEGFKTLLQRNRIVLGSPAETVVATYGVTYAAERVLPTTKVGDLMLNSAVPLVISADRGALDEYNQTMRVAVTSNKKSEDVVAWLDVRTLVKPSTKPYTLHIQCSPGSPDPRAFWEWTHDFTTVSSRCKLRASVNSSVQFELSVLSESGVQCDVDGTATVGPTQIPVQGGKGSVNFALPSQAQELVFKFQNLSRTVDFQPEAPPPVGIEVSVKAMKCSEPMKLSVTFTTATGDLTRLSPDTAQRNVHISLFSLSQEGPTLVRTTVTKFAYSDISVQTNSGIVSRSGVELPYRLVVTDRGYEMTKDFSVILGAGAPADLILKPKTGIKMESGLHYEKEIRVSAVDEGGNPTPLLQVIHFQPPDFVHLIGSGVARPDETGKAVLPKRTMVGVMSGQGVVTVLCGQLVNEVPVEVTPGHAPARMVAGLVHAGVQDTNVVVEAGYFTSHVTLVADIFDESGDLWTLEQPQIQVSMPKSRSTITLPMGSSILGDIPTFALAGEYKIMVALSNSLWAARIPPQMLSIHAHPAPPSIWTITSPKEIVAELNQPFSISGRITDQYHNPVSVPLRLSATTPLLDVDFVDPSKPDSTVAEMVLDSQFAVWVVASPKSGNSLPHDEQFDLHLATLLNGSTLFGDIRVIVRAQEMPQGRKRQRAEPVSRAAIPPNPAARAQKIAQTNRNDARNAELRKIRDLLDLDSRSAVNYTQNNASYYASAGQSPALLCPGYELVYIKWPEHWLPTLEGKSVEFWRHLQTEISRYVSFLNSILIYNNAYEAYRSVQQNFMNTILRGKKVKYTFVQIKDADSKLLTVVRPRDQRDKDLVDLSSLLWVTAALPESVRAGIVSWLRSKCPRWKVCLTKEIGSAYENKSNDTFLCLESATVHRPASQHAEIEGTQLDLHGPRIRYAADPSYLTKLAESVGDY